MNKQLYNKNTKLSYPTAHKNFTTFIAVRVNPVLPPYFRNIIFMYQVTNRSCSSEHMLISSEWTNVRDPCPVIHQVSKSYRSRVACSVLCMSGVFLLGEGWRPCRHRHEKTTAREQNLPNKTEWTLCTVKERVFKASNARGLVFISEKNNGTLTAKLSSLQERRKLAHARWGCWLFCVNYT